MEIELVAPPGAVFRVARRPFAWPPPRTALDLGADAGDRFLGSRFDAPDADFSTLYLGASDVAAIAEVIAHFRLSVGLLDALAEATADEAPDADLDPPLHAGTVPVDAFFGTRTLGSAELRETTLVDLTSPATHAALTHALPEVLFVAGAREFDRGVLLTQDRRITRAVAGFLHGHAHDAAGILYESRLCPGLMCVALWEGRTTLRDCDVEPIAPGHQGLQQAADLLGLHLT